MKVKVGIIGATGYAGVELVRLLLGHPQAELAAVGSVSFAGKAISEVYPNLAELFDEKLTSDEQVLETSEVVFASLPHGLSEKYAESCAAQGKVFIDLGADFRLWAEDDYTQWYGLEYANKALHKSAVYALPELYRDEIKGKKIIGNPGCYPTAISLGLYPALKAGLLTVESIIIDAKSGATGAGRGLAQNTHYPDCNEAFSPYKVAEHRHTPEIEQTLSDIAKTPVRVTFVPHLLPVNRGIIATIYASFAKKTTMSQLRELYLEAYKNEQFVRVCPEGAVANLKNVRMSNYCDISLHIDERTDRIIVVSAIDNMVKGAAGQAIQNMNIVCGFKESMGLEAVPAAF